MRRLRWSVAKRLARLNPALRQVDRLGARWELDPRDWLDLRLIIGQPFEAEQRARFAGLIAEAKPEVLHDVGANFGLYAVLMAKAAPAMRVEAYEPVARTRAKLARNLALNGLEGRVRVHAMALSDAAGEAVISIDPRSSGLSTLAAAAPEAARRDYATSETVPTARLDDLTEAAGRVIALKIDVEGHEPAALAGMPRLLAEARGVAQIEIRERNAAEVRAAMAAGGWREADRIEDELYFVKS
jgi:FkbM family methyltransferase